VVLAWLLAKGAAAIPKASSKEHLQTNLGAVDVTLEDEDIATIDGLPVEKRYVDWPGKHFDF
jgi:diketogulonate reductase-like aldo/keto reductase